jgi:hypothetical protein
MSEVWAGDVVLVGASRSQAASDAPFNLRWLLQPVLGERSFRSFLTCRPSISFLPVGLIAEHLPFLPVQQMWKLGEVRHPRVGRGRGVDERDIEPLG